MASALVSPLIYALTAAAFSTIQTVRAVIIGATLALAAWCWLRLRERAGPRLWWAAVTLVSIPLAWLVEFPDRRPHLNSFVFVLAEAAFVAITVALSARRRTPAAPG